ncbi:MAG: hypothetical protein NZ805_09525 [Armatimonadetes bacterium]|nr:hypothetical protein [Armatimonadota bacterium]
MRGKEYAKRIFDRKPKWAEALEGETKGQSSNPALRTQHFARGGERR